LSFTYTQIKLAIQDYCQNSEATFLNHINDFITSAEDKVFSAIQMAPFRKSYTSVAVVGTPEYTLAAGSVDVFSVRVSKDDEAQASDVDYGPVQYMLRKDYDFLLEAYPGSVSAQKNGMPKYYAVSSAALSSADPTITIRFGPIPDDEYPFTVDYYSKKAADSLVDVGGSSLTWLSATYPQVLLHGCLAEAYTFMKGEPDLVQHYQSQFQEGVMMIKNLGEGRQNEDSYVDGTMKVPSQ